MASGPELELPLARECQFAALPPARVISKLGEALLAAVNGRCWVRLGAGRSVDQ